MSQQTIKSLYKINVLQNTIKLYNSYYMLNSNSINSLYYIDNIAISNQKYEIKSNQKQILKSLYKINVLQNTIKLYNSYYILNNNFNSINSLYWINDTLIISNQKYKIKSNQKQTLNSSYWIDNILQIKSQYQIFYTFNKSSFIVKIQNKIKYNYNNILKNGITMNTINTSMIFRMSSPIQHLVSLSNIIKIIQELPKNISSFKLQINQIQTQNYSIIKNLTQNIQNNYSLINRLSSIENIFTIQKSILNRIGKTTFDVLLSNLLVLNSIQLYNNSILTKIQKKYNKYYSDLLRISTLVLFNKYSIKTSIIYNYNMSFSNNIRLTNYNSFNIDLSILLNYNFEITNSNLIREYRIITYGISPITKQLTLENDNI